MTENKDAIILEQNGEWLTVWFNRPEVRNALVKDLFDQLMEVLDVLKHKQSFRGILFRGTEGFFCAGGDLKSFKAMGAAGAGAREMSLETSHDIANLLSKIRALPQLTVAVVEGAAMAGGFGIACAADIMLVMADTKFALTETRIGLPAAQIAPYVIERVGPAQARKLMLLASKIDGEQAHQIGLADFVAQNDIELNVLIDYVQTQLHACGPHATYATKKILAASQQMTLDEYIPYAANVFTDCLLSDEGQEGFASFIEKRKPVWAEVDEEE
ncbi:MAG: enoyl-CoA hydratase/isomerase family protein [Gammaproteobacteria bacterium]|nr:enoyl-CoA hydratase/isomerase family protein [Gammaproteobacteria bacterium]